MNYIKDLVNDMFLKKPVENATDYKNYRNNVYRYMNLSPIDIAIKNGWRSAVIYYNVEDCAPMGFDYTINKYLEKYNDNKHKIIFEEKSRTWCGGFSNYEVYIVFEIINV